VIELQAFLAAVVGGVIFSIIGIIPGTDETATMAPLTLVVVLLGFPPVVIFAWFVGILVAMQITHTMPTAMAALPGSTMAVPMVHNCSLAKRLGVPHIAMRKMAAGSVIGTLVAIPVAVGFALLLAPLGNMVKPYIGLIFTLGACMIAYMSRGKWGAVISLLPFAILIQGLQLVAKQGVGKTLFISIFLGITIGPMISEIFNVFIPKLRDLQMREKPNEIWLAPETKSGKSFFPNPFKVLTKKQTALVVGTSAIAACTFTFSPVGMTVMLGELIASRVKEFYNRITTTLAVQDGLSNATYIGELIIPLLAFGLPLSPVALGPAAPLFNAPPRFTIEPVHNISHYMVASDYIVYGLIGCIGGAIFAYPLAVRYARTWTEKMFKWVSHEALIGSFLGLICMLSYYEAGVVGIIISLTIGLFGGILHNLFGVHTGVQFMGFYASGWILAKLFELGKIFG
jgi:hypothetical protein